jgi:hypothetical protein
LVHAKFTYAELDQKTFEVFGECPGENIQDGNKCQQCKNNLKRTCDNDSTYARMLRRHNRLVMSQADAEHLKRIKKKPYARFHGFVVGEGLSELKIIHFVYSTLIKHIAF